MENPTKDRSIQLLIRLITARKPLNREELCRQYEMSPRTLRRNLDKYINAGFSVITNNGCVSFEKKDPLFRQVSDLVYFNQEEAAMLYTAISRIEADTEAKRELIDKLGAVYAREDVKERIRQTQRSAKVTTLMQAIEMGVCVKIVGYSSSNSHSLSDRIVEPFAFGPENKLVWCFEPKSMQNKVFALSRMDDVRLLQKQPWEHRSEHRSCFTDAFRMISHDGETHEVELTLNRRSMNIMIDEYPLTVHDIIQVADNEWRYRGRVSNYIGIGRFVLGLADNIKVHTPDFCTYLRKFATLYLTYPEVTHKLHKDIIW